MPSSRRDHLVDTAVALFGRHGFHATGIDRVLRESGVAKMTLYKHFRSKDELILAVLRRRDERFRNWFVRAVERRGRTPRARLLALFDALGEWFAGPDFWGCTFINASAEFGDPDHPIHAAAAEHKRLVLGYVRGLAEAAGAPDPEALARQLMLLAEGAIVIAQVSGEAGAAAEARGAAEVLIAAALGPEAKA
jgi:AcrR family transcriptional regulator